MKRKIILALEGPDNVGKGTQMKKIVSYFKDINFVALYDSLKAGETDSEKVEYGHKREKEYFKVRKYLWDNGIPQINDRSHYSEYAYRMFRNSDKIEDLLAMEKEYSELKDDYLTIIFIDEIENISSRDDGYSAYKKEDLGSIKKLIERFKYIAEKSIYKNYIININGKDENEVFDIIKNLIQEKFKI